LHQNKYQISIFTGLTSFRKMLEKYKQQLNDVNKINSNQMLGMFNLKFDLMKSVVRPTSNLLLELVEETLTKYVMTT